MSNDLRALLRRREGQPPEAIFGGGWRRPRCRFGSAKSLLGNAPARRHCFQRCPALPCRSLTRQMGRSFPAPRRCRGRSRH